MVNLQVDRLLMNGVYQGEEPGITINPKSVNQKSQIARGRMVLTA